MDTAGRATHALPVLLGVCGFFGLFWGSFAVLLDSVLVGGLTEVFGLRTALGTVAVAGALIFVLSLCLAAGDQPSARGKDEI